MSKARCDYCPATYVGRYTDSGGKTCHKCLAHLPNGIEIDFDRYEHLILNEIKKTLPSREYYKEAKIISPKYDKGLMKGVRQRPDLIIRSPLQGNNIVIVEVDEGYHDKEEQRRLDIEREEFFRKKLTDKGKDDRKPAPTISFVRIEPYDLQDNSIVGKMQKMTISPGKKSKKVFKRGEFEGVLKTSISEIRKKLTRRNILDTQTIKITPDNYGYAYPKVRSPLKSPYSRIFPRRRSTLVEEVKTRSISPPQSPKKPSLSSENTEQMVKDFSKMTHKSYEVPKTKVFSKNQKRQIVDMIQKHKDISSYVSSITGRKYKSSNIKLTDKDPIEVHLHVIQGASLGYKDSDILKGAEKLRKESEFRKKSFFQYQKPRNFSYNPALPKKSPGFLNFLGF
jgi:hypothetical protein